MKGFATQSGKVKGLTILGWAVFFILLAVLITFGYKVIKYSGQIRSGELVELPQYTARLTTASGQQVRSSNLSIEPTALVTPDDPVLGASAETAAVTVVMFGDYECGYSKEAAIIFRRMAVRYGDRIRFVYRDYPMSIVHPRAFAAASAAECAKEQRRFWEYFDKLYLNTPALDYADLVAYAEQAGLEMNQFERCLADGRYDALVNTDLLFSEELRLRGTPSFFFNGRRVEGSIPEDSFESTLEKLLK
ncbi:MAG: thioredoxin domain-containing protein [Patescibacteria group bacterium]|nr:thioredoxin domain-containing protein [Patescibacteria group bacterium]